MFICCLQVTVVASDLFLIT